MDKLAQRVARRFLAECGVAGEGCEAGQEPTADWEMTLRDPEGDEPIDVRVGPGTSLAVAPEGWEDTVKEMKKHPEIDNPWALAHWMKGEGYESHKDASYLKFANAIFKASQG